MVFHLGRQQGQEGIQILCQLVAGRRAPDLEASALAVARPWRQGDRWPWLGSLRSRGLLFASDPHIHTAAGRGALGFGVLGRLQGIGGALGVLPLTPAVVARAVLGVRLLLLLLLAAQDEGKTIRVGL